MRYTLLILLIVFPLINYSQTFDDYYENGLLMIKENNIKGAILKLDTAIMISPDSSKAYVARAFAKKQIYNFKSANFDFYEALKLDPQNYSLYNSLEIENLNIRLERFAKQSRTANILLVVGFFFTSIAIIEGNIPVFLYGGSIMTISGIILGIDSPRNLRRYKKF